MMKRLFASTILAISLVGLAGCPGQTFEVWIINSSNTFTISSVKVVSADESTTVELVTDEGVEPDTIRIFGGIDVAPFNGAQVTVRISGTNANKGFDTDEVTVEIPGTVQPGTVIPIRVSGESTLTFDGDYIGLDTRSKVMHLIEP